MSQTKAQLLDGKSATIQFSAGSASVPAVTFTGDTNTGIYSPGADQVAISTNGTGRLFVNNLGDIETVGSSNWNFAGLAIRRTSSNTADSKVISFLLDGDTRNNTNLYSNVNFVLRTDSAPTTGSTSSGLNAGLEITSPATIRFGTNGSERLRITSAGLVGVGVSSPQLPLTIGLGGGANPATSGSTQSSGGIARIGSSGAAALDIGTLAAGPVWLQSTNVTNLATNYSLLLNPNGGNVGIGTTSPPAGALLAVNGQPWVLGQNALLFMNADNTLGCYINGSGAAGVNPAMVFSTSYVERARIDSSGNLGIGSSSPQAVLHVERNQAAESGIFINNSNAGGYVAVRLGNSDRGTNGDHLVYGGTVLGLRSKTGTSITFEPAGTERARIDSSGRLLVGTSSARANFFNSTISSGIQLEGAGIVPSNRFLSVVNNYATAGDGGGVLILGRSKGGTVGSNDVVASGDQLGRFDFQGSDGTELVSGAMIEAYVDGTPGANDMPGRLVFSTTADGASSPTERMRISNTGTVLTYSTDDCISARASQGAGTSYFFYRGMQGASSTTAGGTTSFIVYTNGNVQNTNNSYAGISDLRLKENIVDATSQWADIKALQVRKYNFREETGQQTHTQIGLIAQEVELVSPGLVSESPDRDEDGNDLGTVTKSVNYSVLYMKAVKALQEAMERIETLEAAVATLQGS